MFEGRAREAVDSVFTCQDEVSLSKVRSAAKKLCKELNLVSLTKSVENSKGCSLKMFFTAKTHKVDRPLRVIVSEEGTWQKSVARFLQEKLALLGVKDPFLTRGSEEVAEFFKENHDQTYTAFSVDIKDL